jgi:aminopeptidase N
MLALNNIYEVDLDVMDILDIQESCYYFDKVNPEPVSISALIEDDTVDQGSKLTIQVSDLGVGDGIAAGTEFFIRIDYDLGSEYTVGMQWLTSDQTHDKAHPIVYTESLAIYGRSLIPIQDTPSVKFSWDAKISVPLDTPNVYMSAD